jgi:Transposase IS200 like
MPEYNPALANPFCSFNVHGIFSTKERVPMLNPELRERLWPFLGGIAKQNGIKPRSIGRVADQVHLLLSLPTTGIFLQAGSLRYFEVALALGAHLKTELLNIRSIRNGQVRAPSSKLSCKGYTITSFSLGILARLA